MNYLNMNNMKRLKFYFKNYILVILLYLPMGSVFATLGQPLSTINADAADLGINISGQDLQNYKVESFSNNVQYSFYQITSSSGIEVKQYVANDKVFAIVWQGESTPNLSQLLGKYFHVYESATPKYKSSTLESIEQQDFIAYFGSSRGHFYGKALVPSLIPEGLNYIRIK